MQPLATVEVRHYAGTALRHSHDHHQIVLPLQGRMAMEVEGREDAVDTGRAALLTAGERHLFSSGGENAFLVLDLPQRAEHERLWDHVLGKAFLNLDEDVTLLTRFIARESQDRGLDGLAAQHASDLLLSTLAKRLDLPLDRSQGPVARAASLMRAHFDQPLSLDWVADQAGLSLTALHSGFHRVYGMTPGRYLSHCRLEEVRRLLADSDLPLAQIAQATGFGDQSALGRAFKREEGMTLLAYRRQFRHKKAVFGSRPLP